MRWIHWLTTGIWSLFHDAQLDRDAREEMAFHVAERERDLIRQGLNPPEARRIARAEFGSVSSAAERTREAWAFRRLSDLTRDVRHTARLLARAPAFTLIAMLSIAIGVGATSSTFSIADALLFRPLGIADPGRLLSVGIARPDEAGTVGLVSYPNYLDFRDRVPSFDGVIAYQLIMVRFADSREVSPDMRMGMEVSDNFFNVLGVPAALGRTFAADEGRVPDRDAILVLGHDFWAGALHGDPSVVGRTLWLNGVAFTVIGVAPERFTGMDQYIRPAFFVPAAIDRRLARTDGDQIDARTARVFEMRARLKRGMSRARAGSEAAAAWQRLVDQYPDANRRTSPTLRTDYESRVLQSPEDARLMWMMLALVSVVLVIACANVANLLLGRARGRAREMAIRLALGVSRARLFGQLMTESCVLAAGGCALGVVFARTQMHPIDIPTDLPIVVQPQIDGRFLLFALAATGVSAVVFGLVPAWQSAHTQLVPALKGAQAGRSARLRTPGRSMLVAAQIALSMALLVAAGIVFDGFRKAMTMDPGFRRDHLLAMTLDTSMAGRSNVEARTFFRELSDGARAIPGVVSAALTSAVPLDNTADGQQVVPEGHQFPPGQESVGVLSATITDRYFDTIDTPIVRGRAFTADDRASSQPVVIINEQFAQTFWPNQDALGKRLRLADSGSPWMTIVGIAKMSTYIFLAEPPHPFVYLPQSQHDRSRLSLVVQSATADPAELVTPLRNLVRTLDPSQPIYNVRSMSTFYEQRALAIPRGMLETIGPLAGIGALLALIGLYGLVAYSVACRTREIGIRMAIGASPADVRRMVLRQGMFLAVSGLSVGALASVGVSRVVHAGLSGLGEARWPLLVTVSMVLVGLTMAASAIPARRASRLDPLRAVRDE